MSYKRTTSAVLEPIILFFCFSCAILSTVRRLYGASVNSNDKCVIRRVGMWRFGLQSQAKVQSRSFNLLRNIHDSLSFALPFIRWSGD